MYWDQLWVFVLCVAGTLVSWCNVNSVPGNSGNGLVIQALAAFPGVRTATITESSYLSMNGYGSLGVILKRNLRGELHYPLTLLRPPVIHSHSYGEAIYNLLTA